MRHARILAASLAALLALAACTPRGTLGIVPDATGGVATETIFIVTSRAKDDITLTPAGDRSFNEGYARYDISIPPNREVGDINWPPPGETPDATRDFVTTRAVEYPDARNFRAGLSQALQQSETDPGAVVIFVHGFNTNFSEGLYRLAQISHDLDLRGTVVHYSWPSQASALGYLYDRDSALFARDGLEQTIDDVRAAGATRITLVAHSMGSYLTMETLRQMGLRNPDSVDEIIDAVVLLSPDIDVDVFVAQAQSVGQLPDPFLIFTAADDKALGLSARLSQDGRRLGNLTDPAPLADLDVTLLDITNFTEGGGHFAAATSPELVAIIDRVRDMGQFYDIDDRARVGLGEAVVLTVQNAALVVVPSGD
jgi:esterase/lipase superfamily enzyme